MDDPIIEDPPVEGEAPEPEPFVLPENFADEVKGWEVPIEDLPLAVKQYKALQTEDGVIDAFISTGQALGFGLKELNRLFDDDPAAAVAAVSAAAAAAPPAEPEDPDRLMTAAEVQQMLAEVRQEQQGFQERQQQEQFQARQKQTFDAIDTWFGGQEVKDEETRRAIANFAERHLAPGADSYDPRVAIAALEQGKADYEAWVEREAQSYLRRKQAAASNQPTPVGGGTGGTAGSEGSGGAPDYAKLGSGALAAAKERVRNRLREAGELG